LPDGRLLPILCNAGPIRDAAGNVTGGIVAWRDISDLVKLEEERELLVHELSHRVKNLFAVMGSMVRLTASGTDDVQQMAGALIGRIEALARAHDLIRPAGDVPSARGGTNLADLFERLLAPDLDRGGPQCQIGGPHQAIGPAAATKLAMVIHELATNAAKYGALSASSGMVRVTWQEQDGSLLLRWHETGGPPVADEPEESGFGGKLIEATVRQLEGEIGYTWGAAGLRVTLSLPIQSLQE
jgi:two-component sensor histidine kinase